MDWTFIQDFYQIVSVKDTNNMFHFPENVIDQTICSFLAIMNNKYDVNGTVKFRVIIDPDFFLENK